MAALCRLLCNTIVPWDNIRALLASRLIALDKCPGVRPIGVGETLRRIVGKTICLVTRSDAAVICGKNQLCAGLQCGIEGAIHAMNELFEINQAVQPGWGVLLIDASNAFNSSNRIAMLLNVRKFWPRCARFVFNTYRGWPVLVLRGHSEFLFSREGVTQGDPLSMFVYAIGTLPLIHSLEDACRWTQLWYADDASAGGLLEDLLIWFKLLCSRGPSFGYCPQPAKCFVVVAPSFLDHAKDIFSGLGVQVVSGHRFLGGFIGDPAQRRDFVSWKVQDWSSYVQTLAAVASSQPQAAYAALTKSLQFEWMFTMRVNRDCSSLMTDLEHCLCTVFLPALFGVEVTSSERQVFGLPLQYGGLGIINPVAIANHYFDSSVRSTTFLCQSILGTATFELDEHVFSVRSAKQLDAQIQANYYTTLFNNLISRFDPGQQRAILRAKASSSSWLSVVPLEIHHFDLACQEFRDALALRYRKPLLGLPTYCDGCGSPFIVDHALDCRVG